MAQRQMAVDQTEAFPGQNELDDFPTPPWGTRALIRKLNERRALGRISSVWEPAANRGFMVRPLQETFETVLGTDFHDYGAGFNEIDFLTIGSMPYPLPERGPDWVITNPPFIFGEKFIYKALDRCTWGTAMLLRTQFLEGGGRYERLYLPRRPHYVFQYVERLPILKGKCVRQVIDPKTGELKDASTATAYCWLVFLKVSKAEDTIYDWIAPCRHELERHGDYQDDVAADGKPSPQGDLL